MHLKTSFLRFWESNSSFLADVDEKLSETHGVLTIITLQEVMFSLFRKKHDGYYFDENCTWVLFLNLTSTEFRRNVAILAQVESRQKLELVLSRRLHVTWG